MKKILIFFLLLAIGTLRSQSLQSLYAESTKAYRAKDYPKFLELCENLNKQRPSHPAYTFNLACAYALNNRPEQALAFLTKAVLMDNRTDFENEANLLSLKNTEGFQGVLQLKSDQNLRVAHSQKVTELSEKDLHPEGLVYLEKSKMWLVSSIHKRKITAFDPKTGKCEDWINDNMLAVFAMKPDKAGKFLWVATTAMPEMAGFTPDLDGKAEILKIDIASKKIVSRFSLEGKHVFGDLAVSEKGTVYISDSAEPVIYTILEGKITEWTRFADGVYNLQGIAFNADGGKIYLADYFRGIASVSVKNPKEIKWLNFPGNRTCKGIDGLIFYKNSLIAIHNGVKPIRIVRYFLGENDKILSAETIDNNRPEFNEPALAALKDGTLYFFANAPWNAYSKDSELEVSKIQNPQLFSFRVAE